MAEQTTPNGNGQQSKAMVVGPQARLNTLRGLFDKSKASIAAVLPKHLTPERLIKIATSAASRNPDLLDCTPESVLLAVVQAGTLGLEPNTPLRHCHLVPFNNTRTSKKEAQLIIGYAGLCQLAYQSGEVLSIFGDVIHANDLWDVEKGTNKRLFHKPCVDGKDPGAPIAYYAVVEFKHGGKDFVFMTAAEVNAIRASSQGRDGDGWVKHPEEMGKKTAIRRLSKTMPMSPDKSMNFARGVAIDGRAAKGEAPDYEDVINVLGEPVVASEEPKDRGEALAASIGGKP
jgi:recombination protein RecT